MKSDLGLIRYDAARHALREAKRVDEVKSIKDKAEAIRAYGIQSNDTELVSWASEIKLRAMRQMGALLDEMEKAEGGRPRKTSSAQEPVLKTRTLSDLGISKKLSATSQKIAAIPEPEFESHITETREKAKEVTTAGVMKLIQTAERHAARKDRLVTYADPPWRYEHDVAENAGGRNSVADGNAKSPRGPQGGRRGDAQPPSYRPHI